MTNGTPQSDSRDPLTGLPDRALFLDRLAHTLEMAEREKKLAALMFVDLDGFKEVNDRLGHSAGDRLLQETAERIQSVLRRSDTVARVGGDEFTVILPDLRRELEAVPAATKILRSLAAPFLIDGALARISASIGITIFPNDGSDVDTLLANADLAMYRAKEGGRNAYRFFTAQMNIDAGERQRLEDDLRLALERDQFEIYFQPILDLRAGTVKGAEALVRWKHPHHGMYLPAEFLPVAEEAGLMEPIDALVLQRACEVASAWPDSGLPRLDLYVNVSDRQFLRRDFPRILESTLERCGLPARRLILEIRESLLLQDTDAIAPVLRTVRASGVRICIDDFGTGVTSLRSLRDHTVDMLKIDRRFLGGLCAPGGDNLLVEAILALGRGLGLEVLGEGVETLAQAAFLLERGCDRGQGYLFCNPLPSAEFHRYATAPANRTLP